MSARDDQLAAIARENALPSGAGIQISYARSQLALQVLAPLAGLPFCDVAQALDDARSIAAHAAILPAISLKERPDPEAAAGSSVDPCSTLQSPLAGSPATTSKESR